MAPKLKNNKKRSWTVISCQCDSEEEEDICSWLFFQYDTLGIENKHLADGRLLLVASFAEDNPKITNLAKIRQHFEECGLEDCAKTLTLTPLADQDWLSNWKIHFEPFKIGDTFMICPPWAVQNIPDLPLSETKKIIIDPGMAFGTGLHATTSFCLQAIEKYLKGPNILDVGTGSGILSIASAITSRGANITAIDLDENAVENAKHNAALNFLTSHIDIRQESLAQFDQHNSQKFDTVFANVTAEVIVESLPVFNKLTAIEGNLILAGIIEERLDMLTEAMSNHPFKLVDKKLESGWVGLVYAKTWWH